MEYLQIFMTVFNVIVEISLLVSFLLATFGHQRISVEFESLMRLMNHVLHFYFFPFANVHNGWVTAGLRLLMKSFSLLPLASCFTTLCGKAAASRGFHL